MKYIIIKKYLIFHIKCFIFHIEIYNNRKVRDISYFMCQNKDKISFEIIDFSIIIYYDTFIDIRLRKTIYVRKNVHKENVNAFCRCIIVDKKNIVHFSFLILLILFSKIF